MVIWELSTGKYQIFSDLNVELFHAKFRTDRLAYEAPTNFFQFPRQYVWLDATSILFVDHGSSPPQWILAFSSLSGTLRTMRQRTEEGLRSVRVWNDQSPTCGTGSRLIRMACDTGRLESVYEGDVRGVSVSPNGRWLAAVVATRNIPPAPDKPMQWPLRATPGPDDDMVELKLTLIELTKPGRARDIEGVDAVGNVAPSRLPLWTTDSSRMAFPVRTTYSEAPSTGNDAVWEVSADTGVARKWSASSALDAELLAALLTTDGLNARVVIERRPQETRPENYTDGGQVRGGAWRCGPQQVLVWNSPTLTLISPDRTVMLPGRFASVQPTVVGDSVARTLAMGGGGLSSLITTWNGNYRIETIPAAPEWTLLAVRPRDAGVVYCADTDSGTFLILTKHGVSHRSSPLSFNTYFRDVIAPQRRMLSCAFPDGSVRTGLLQLPICHRAGGRHPVIVWAYPNSTPFIGDAFSRANSAANVIYPVQYLLTKGFAFFQAPLPLRGRRSFRPMRAAVDAVLPWLDVLSRQPDILPKECGFFGHSNAGYVALALEALTECFRAIVAWNTFPAIGYDTLHSNAGNLALNCAANIVQVERMYYEDPKQPYAPQPSPPWRNPAEYIRNDPVFNLKRASTPLLLVEGEFDTDPREMEEVYSILYGRGVPVELAYYWGEDHVFASPGNTRDSWLRTERFFNTYLQKG